MIPLSEQTLLAIFKLALAAGGFAAWWRRDSADEDEMVSACHDIVLDAVSDADMTGKVNCRTGENWRDQLSVAEAEELNRERQLRKFDQRN